MTGPVCARCGARVRTVVVRHPNGRTLPHSVCMVCVARPAPASTPLVRGRLRLVTG